MSEVKNITIITANYFPEDTAIGLYTTQFSEYLSAQNVKVQIITGFPCYPKWLIPESYKSKPRFFKEDHQNIEIIRYKQYVPKKVTLITRVLMMLSLFWGTLWNIRKIEKSDLVFCIIPYTISTLPSYLLAKRKKAKLWIHIQDFEFDLAFESGILSKDGGITKKIITSFERKMLNSADFVSSISNSMMQKVLTKSNKKEVIYFPNWVSRDKINPETSKPHPYITPEKFTLLYSGNIGEKQNWDLFYRLCALIREDDSISIVVVGNGASLDTVRKNSAPYDFVTFYDTVPYEELSDLLCAANLHFLFQKENVVDTVMPSKLLGMMASAKPSIITGNEKSEVRSILQEAAGGYFIASDDAQFVYEKILHLKQNPEVCNKMGAKSRDYILNNFSEEAVLSNIYRKIETELS